MVLSDYICTNEFLILIIFIINYTFNSHINNNKKVMHVQT